MNKPKSIRLKILSESVMIIFSVLIALFINEWRNNYNQQLKTYQIIKNIEEELSVNQVLIAEQIIYHQKVKDKIEDVYRQNVIDQIFFPHSRFRIDEVAPNGLIQERLSDIAWTVAKADKITNRIQFPESQILFAVYDQQETVNETIERIIDFLTSREIQRKELLNESVLILESYIKELVAQEKNLDSKYLKALNMLEDRQERL